MRVLWVTSNHPDPAATGGSAHEFDIIRSMAPRHQIHVLTSNLVVDPEQSALPQLGVTVERLEHVVHDHPDTRLGVAAAMLRAKPTLLLWLLRDRLVKLSAAVERAERAERFDLVHATHGEMAPVLAAAKAPTTLLLFDSYVRQKDRALELETIPRRRLQLRVERRRAEQWERRWFADVDGLAAVSPLDAAVTAKLLGRRVETIENPVPEDFFVAAERERDAATVTFVGSLLYPPNIDAITWLAEDIWPLVLDKVPAARLHIVGRSDGSDSHVDHLRTVVEPVGGQVFADVPDIRKWYWGATAVVAPIRLGSGLRNKVIHAMACGAPVVATSAALEGVEAVAGRDVLVGEGPAELAAHLVTLLTDATTAARITAGGRVVAEQFRSSVVNQRFDEWWGRTAAAARAR